MEGCDFVDEVGRSRSSWVELGVATRSSPPLRWKAGRVRRVLRGPGEGSGTGGGWVTLECQVFEAREMDVVRLIAVVVGEQVYI